MLLESFKTAWDYELLDSGDGYRLEKWGDTLLARPDPQVIWSKSLPESEWQKAWATFKTGKGEEKGNWEISKPLPKPWVVEFNYPPLTPPLQGGELKKEKGEESLGVKFLLKLSPFKHTGLFAEQAAQWSWMTSKLSSSSSHKVESKPKILNLFAYTGGATMVLAKAGCHVTHVDASKPSLTWANENYKLNFSNSAHVNKRPLTSAQGEHSHPGNVRWILDDCVKFVKRELKRGEKYDGIIMDPPAFGHSPTGKTWKFNQDLPGLLEDCINLLSEDAKFLLINGYATNSSALALNNLLEDKIKNRTGKSEFGELCLEQKSGRKISTGIFARWTNQN